jgi:hypothetical protein
MTRPMVDDDFGWASALMEERRRRYEQYSPVFWRPAEGATAGHEQFLRELATREGTVARRTDHGFVVAVPRSDRFEVDDFAVDADERWATDGQALLLATSGAGGVPDGRVRVVTARDDRPKTGMLAAAGLVATARWWVRELSPGSASPAWGPVDLDGISALMVPAPPVYGPVALLGDAGPAVAVRAAESAADRGAVLAVVQRDRSPEPAPASEPELEAAGFHNASALYEGTPA